MESTLTICKGFFCRTTFKWLLYYSGRFVIDQNSDCNLAANTVKEKRVSAAWLRCS